MLDGRNASRAKELVKSANIIFLEGGHVPTQNRFFASINLRRLLNDFDGVLIGFSAGSMNSAETVYAMPEENGEAVDPSYERFLPGLGLTKTMLIPHFSYYRREKLDGLRILKDILLPDSMGKEFICIEDGSYLLIESGREVMYGKAYLAKDGAISELSEDGESVMLQG